MDIPVLEVHRGGDGVWETLESHVLGSEDIDTVDGLDGMPRVQGLVRVGGALKRLTVYVTGKDEGVVTWNDAYGA